MGNISDRSIKENQPGEKGQEKRIKMVVHTIADIGLVGFPNAGKSTLIASLTRSKPKIADYEFTTLNPNLGDVKFVDGSKITIVDIPGLIEGASENKGLGHEFLNHCTKAKLIVYVINMSFESKISPWEQLNILKSELQNYSTKLLEKPWTVVGTKSDIAGSDLLAEQFKSITGIQPVMVSARASQGLSMLVKHLKDKITENN